MEARVVLSARVKKFHWEPENQSVEIELATGQLDPRKVTELVAVLGKDALVHLVPSQQALPIDGCDHKESTKLLGQDGERVCLACGLIYQVEEE